MHVVSNISILARLRRCARDSSHLSAYLGLVPGHSNTGNKTVMLPITKRGNRYLRTLLIHGARSALYAARNKDDSRSLWLQRLQSRRGNNIAAVALANKNARVAWAVLRFGQTYRPDMGTLDSRARRRPGSFSASPKAD